MTTALKFNINQNSTTPIYRQLVQTINQAIAKSQLNTGDALPSVNQLCSNYNLSRDTVFKAYSVLKEEGTVESVPNKGYFVANETRKVLLLIDTFKAYKEVLYHSFVDNIEENTIVDVQFHHYHFDNFKSIINNALGKYTKYVVMPFKHKEVYLTLSKINPKNLLILDWNTEFESDYNSVFQDFGQGFSNALQPALSKLKRYQKVNFIYPTYTNHPEESKLYFKKFCEENKIDFTIKTEKEFKTVTSGEAYISVSDRILGKFLAYCKAKGLEPGVNVGFLSYNETPMKQFIHKGITVVSTDFEAMGKSAAEFVNNNQPLQRKIPTTIHFRNSL